MCGVGVSPQYSGLTCLHGLYVFNAINSARADSRRGVEHGMYECTVCICVLPAGRVHTFVCSLHEFSDVMCCEVMDSG